MSENLGGISTGEIGHNLDLTKSSYPCFNYKIVECMNEQCLKDHFYEGCNGRFKQ